MEAGDILRLRRVKTYGFGDDRNSFEFSPDCERSRKFQQVFVVMLLGREMRKLVKAPGSTEVEMAPLDVDRACNGLGLWSEAQLVELLGAKRAEEVIKALHNKRLAQIQKGRHTNARLEALKTPPKGDIDIRG
jgi:hypothetical protein